MPASEPPILGLCAVDPQLRRLVSDTAASAGAQVRGLESVAAACSGAASLAALFYERCPFDGVGGEVLRDFRERHPAIPVLVYVSDPERDDFEPLISEAVRLPGVTFRIRRRAANEGLRLQQALGVLLRDAPAWHVLSLVETALGEAPPLIRAVLRAALLTAAEGRKPTVRALGATLGVSARTLERRCSGGYLPRPKELLSWCALLLELRLAAWAVHGAPPRAGGAAIDRLSRELMGQRGSALDPRSHLERAVQSLAERARRVRGAARRNG
jgi:hypothetical protein